MKFRGLRELKNYNMTDDNIKNAVKQLNFYLFQDFLVMISYVLAFSSFLVILEIMCFKLRIYFV
jgi:hypothetical protein